MSTVSLFSRSELGCSSLFATVSGIQFCFSQNNWGVSLLHVKTLDATLVGQNRKQVNFVKSNFGEHIK